MCLPAWRGGPATLFGAITIVTGPTVVLPLLRHVRLKSRPASFLKWEAIVNDPIGAILAAVVLETLVSGMTGHLASRLLLGLGDRKRAWHWCRFLGAVRCLSKDMAPEILKTPILLALALGVDVSSDLVMDDAGLVAATLFGVTIANLHVPGTAELRRFKEALVVLIVSALFITLTADLDRATLVGPVLATCGPHAGDAARGPAAHHPVRHRAQRALRCPNGCSPAGSRRAALSQPLSPVLPGCVCAKPATRVPAR